MSEAPSSRVEKASLLSTRGREPPDNGTFAGPTDSSPPDPPPAADTADPSGLRGEPLSPDMVPAHDIENVQSGASPKTRPPMSSMDVSSNSSSSSEDHHSQHHHYDVYSDDGAHRTTFWQTYIHLLKGYIGCGVLSLPWAVSQLGLPLGCAAIFIMAYWSSYNCWIVVKLKRFIERRNATGAGSRESLDLPVHLYQEGNDRPDTSQTNPTSTSSPRSSQGPYISLPSPQPGSTSSHNAPSEGAASSSRMTYPDVGEWAYGSSFHTYITACICVQQLAICTVFMSFIAENLYAVLRMSLPMVTHLQVLSLALPVVLLLSFLPTLKHLAPVMVAATMLILLGFICLAGVGWIEWDERPLQTPTLQPSMAPLALCAILYSFEGICLILPVESAMREPKEFKQAFVWSMVSVAIILALVACLSVMAFGYVSNGSITAFLLEKYGNQASNRFFLMLVNTAVSMSILLTYPLQLFPAVELMAPIMAKYSQFMPWCGSGEVDDEHDLANFEPLPSIDEHDTVSVTSIPAQQHDYSNTKEEQDSMTVTEHAGDRCRLLRRLLPQMMIPGDSILLRTMLVLSTYTVASLVPHVENLISLAGAVAGSSTALLIPPILELAWIRQLEKDHASNSGNTSSDELSYSAYWIMTTARNDKFLLEKVKSWILLVFGLLFAVIGTYASISDIVRLYKGN